jgi:hypothetical protein
MSLTLTYSASALRPEPLFCAAGGQPQDALSVCAREMGDPQLALFLGRLMETTQQPLLPALVKKELLPGARTTRSPISVHASR